MLVRTYLPAKKVEIAVEKALKTLKIKDEVCSYPHINNREKGFELKTWEGVESTSVFIYENRNSDDIGVTTSKTLHNWAGVTEEEWKKTKYFREGDIEKATHHVIAQLFINQEAKCTY